MDRFQKLGVLLNVLFLFLSLVLYANAQDDDWRGDFPGPYCATRPGGCCNNRTDSCSVPIAGTVHIPNNNNIDRDMIIYTIFLLNSAEKICIEIHVECILS